MHYSRSRGKNPQNPDNAQSPAPGVGANSSSNVRSVETSPGLGFQSISAPPSSSEPSPFRRSLRISEASSSGQSPQPTIHAIPASASPSAETSLELGFQATSASPHPRPRVPRRNPRMSTGGKVGKGGGNFLLVPKSVIGESGSKKKRGRPPKGIRIGGNGGYESVARRNPALPKRTEILKDVEVVVVVVEEEQEEEEVLGGDNAANGDGSETVNFADSQSGGVKIAGEEFMNVRSTSRGIDKGKGILNEELPRERPSYKDKGKGMMIENVDSEPVKISDSESDENGELVEGAIELFSLSQPSLKRMKPMPEDLTVILQNRRRESQRNKAIELAPDYARFTNEKGDETVKDEEPLPNEPGPFSTAVKIIEERAVKFRADEADSSKGNKSAGVTISWTPYNEGKNGLFGRKKPTLRELSVKALAANADEIESLVGIPCAMRSQLSFMLCHNRKMNMHHLGKLMEGRLTELQLSDCSWASEENFENAFGKCDKSKLEVELVHMC